jgi:pimeloyl-ACP methyl ester carboxylesterase
MPAIHQVPQRFVDSADGARIAVYEEGNPEGPPVVLVHGFPDSHVLWDGVVPHLAERFRVIRYDNRGVGLSSVPKPVSAYTMDRFADDFAAVTGELSPGSPVHVLAHDWGSVGMWEYLKRPGAGDRVASFTSVSGPSHEQLVDYIFSGLRRPWRPRLAATAARPPPRSTPSRRSASSRSAATGTPRRRPPTRSSRRTLRPTTGARCSRSRCRLSPRAGS